MNTKGRSTCHLRLMTIPSTIQYIVIDNQSSADISSPGIMNIVEHLKNVRIVGVVY